MLSLPFPEEYTLDLDNCSHAMRKRLLDLLKAVKHMETIRLDYNNECMTLGCTNQQYHARWTWQNFAEEHPLTFDQFLWLLVQIVSQEQNTSPPMESFIHKLETLMENNDT